MTESLDYIPYIIFIVLFYVGATALFLSEINKFLLNKNNSPICIKSSLCISFSIPFFTFIGLYYYNKDLCLAAILLYSFFAFMSSFCIMGYNQYSRQYIHHQPARTMYEQL
jgi:hypothetical protein